MITCKTCKKFAIHHSTVMNGEAEIKVIGSCKHCGYENEPKIVDANGRKLFFSEIGKSRIDYDDFEETIKHQSARINSIDRITDKHQKTINRQNTQITHLNQLITTLMKQLQSLRKQINPQTFFLSVLILGLMVRLNFNAILKFIKIFNH